MDTQQAPAGERIWAALEGIAGAIWVLVILFVTLLALRNRVSAETIGLVLIVPPLVAAVSGRAAALVMALACALLFNVFFIPPYYSLTIGSSEGVTAFVVYTVVALAVAFIAGRLREARDHEERRVGRRQELLLIAERLVRGEQPSSVLDDRIGPLAASIGIELRLDVDADGGVRCIAQGAPDPDQAATLDELDRLLAAAYGTVPRPTPATAAFWDLG